MVDLTIFTMLIKHKLRDTFPFTQFFFGHEPTTQKATYDIYKTPKINPHFLFPMDTIIMSKETQT